MTELPRRRLLAGTGTALAGALAGCSSSTDDGANGDGDGTDTESETGPETGSETELADSDENETEGADEDVDGTILGDIDIENVHDEGHTVDVLVEFDDEIEHWTTHELEAGEGTALDRNWTTDVGALRVVVRLDGGSPTQIEPSRWNDPDCLNLFVLVGRDGELTVLGDTSSGHCGDGESEFDEDA